MKRIVAIALILCVAFSLFACGNSVNSNKTSEQTTEDKVRSAVESKGILAHYGTTIGGNELSSSKVTITNVKKVSETKYRVSGKIVMTDVYGTGWNNTFDCEVTYSDIKESWRAGSFDYKNKNWTKG